MSENKVIRIIREALVHPRTIVAICEGAGAERDWWDRGTIHPKYWVQIPSTARQEAKR